MAIVYVAAENFELQPFARFLHNRRKLDWPLEYAVEGAIKERRLVLLANGAGPKLAGKAVQTAFRALTGIGLGASEIDAVVTTGFCGALAETLKINNIVVGSEVFDPVANVRFPCATPRSARPFTLGSILSQDRIANSAAEKFALSLDGTVAVEMEAAGVAPYVQKANVPFLCIKVVSDEAGESFPLDLNTMRGKEGRIARGKISIHALRHPVLLPKLWSLKRRSDQAARALGEFLVSCTISSTSA